MDIVTQGLLGGVLAQSVAHPVEKKTATLIGIAAGLLADADVLIRSAQDPLLTLEYHRHFTHALLFIPFGAAIACLLLWPWLRRRLSLARLYLFCLAGYSMSGVLDAFTSYGTHLFWPFSEQRVALNIISIVDPLFTALLLITLLLGLRISSRRIAYAGLMSCAVYLGFGALQLQRAEQLAQDLMVQRGHTPSQWVVKPTLGNLVLWRSVYINDDRIYVDAIRVGWFSEPQIYPGESVTKFDEQKIVARLEHGSALQQDIARFRDFSAGFIALDPQQPNVLGDMRYSMLPISARPLWGLVIDWQQPHQHAEYRFFRQTSTNFRQTFINLLLGRCAEAECG